MVIIAVLFWLIIILLTLLALLLLLNIRVSLQGHWCDSWEYTLLFGLGPIYFAVSPTPEGQQETIIKLNNWVFYRFRKKQAAPNKLDHGEKPSLKELRPFLRGEFLKKVLTTFQAVYNRVQDRDLCIRGALGFSDPYYTGILAACSSLIPGLEVEPVFSGPYRDVELKIGGRLPLGILVYYLLKLLMSREAREVWKAKRELKKEKSLSKGANPWKKRCLVR